MEDPGEVQGHLALADGRRGDGVPFMIYVKYFFFKGMNYDELMKIHNFQIFFDVHRGVPRP